MKKGVVIVVIGGRGVGKSELSVWIGEKYDRCMMC